MDTLGKYARGHFEPQELKRYVIALTLGFWGLIFAAWLLYPAHNKYSIMTHTFSFLGSFEEKHSPRWWWIFSIAMVWWGGAAAPLVLYMRRHFACVFPAASWIGAALMLVGCVNIAMVGVFPDARTTVMGTVRLTDIHEKAAILAAAGFTLGILWHGLLLLADLARAVWNRQPAQVAAPRLVFPYLFWLSVTSIGVSFLARWEVIYAEMKAQARITGVPIGSSWSEALNTRYSFPLWENVLIYALFIFLIWFALALSSEEGA